MPDRVCESCGRFTAVTVRKVHRKELPWWDWCTDCLALVTDWFDNGKKPEDESSDDSDTQSGDKRQDSDEDSGERNSQLHERNCRQLGTETFRSSEKGPVAI